MSDDEGNYDMVGYKLHGFTLADATGGYQMEMIVPACYEPRHAKHIHVKVQGISRPLTTQLYFSDDEERLKDNWYYPRSSTSRSATIPAAAASMASSTSSSRR